MVTYVLGSEHGKDAPYILEARAHTQANLRNRGTDTLQGTHNQSRTVESALFSQSPHQASRKKFSLVKPSFTPSGGMQRNRGHEG